MTPPNDATRKTIVPATDGADVTRSVMPQAFDTTKAQSPEEMFVSVERSLTLPIVAGYLIEEQIGEGGMGVVYRAMQFKLNRIVALKMVIGGKTASAKDLIRFLAEAEAVASIDHPYVISVYEFGDAEGRPYLAMEHLPGGSLTDRIRSQGRIEPREAAELMRKLAMAVQAAHDRQIVHRDLKPSNILFDANGEPRVTDFGLAKRAGGSDLTGTIAIMGTAAYMAPEQARGESKFVGPGADIWALGVILYECLAGSRPFTGVNELEVLRKVSEHEPTVIRNRIPSIAMDLDLIAQKCLSKSPLQRYATAADLAEDLRRWLAGEPVSVKRAGPIERLTKWVRRNKVAAGIIVASLLGTAFATTLAIYAYQQRQRANDEASIALAANNFVQNDILNQADSRQQADRKFKPDPDLKVRTALDRAAEKVGTAYQNQPKTELAIRRSIGNAYRSVGQTSKAIEQLTRAEALANDQYGPDHRLTLGTQQDLAIAYHLAGKNGEAIPRFQSLQAPMLKAHGPDHRDTLSIQENLALSYADAGRKKEAITLLEQLQQHQERLHGATHPQTLGTLSNLATVYQDDGRVKQAIGLYEQIRDLKLASADFGKDHPSTINTLNNLATAYAKDSRVTDAIALLKSVVQSSTDALGKDHPDTLRTLNNLGDVLGQNKQFPDAIAIYTQLRDVQLLSKDYGLRHRDTLRTLNNLARTHYEQGNFLLAIPIFEQARDTWRQMPDSNDPDELDLLRNLGEAYTQAGRMDDSLKTWDGIVPRARANPELGPDHPETRKYLIEWSQMLVQTGQYAKAVEPMRDLIALELKMAAPDEALLARAYVQLGTSLLELGQIADAEPALRECLKLREKLQPGAWTTFNTRSLLGGVLLKQKKYTDAEPLLTSGYAGLTVTLNEIPPAVRTVRLGDALDRLIAIAEATMKHDDVKKWQAEKDKLTAPK